MSLTLLDGTYGIARLEPSDPTPGWATGVGFVSTTRTEEELSVMCRDASIPPDVTAERGWRLLRVAGTLDFSLTGIVHALTGPLAEAGISVFVVSTFDTDYLAVREPACDRAVECLTGAGFPVADVTGRAARG